jgi:hypothetical protein
VQPNLRLDINAVERLSDRRPCPACPQEPRLVGKAGRQQPMKAIGVSMGEQLSELAASVFSRV